MEKEEQWCKPEVRKMIEGAKTLYRTFAVQFESALDLSRPNTIESTVDTARSMGIYENAKEIRELIFGRNLTFYGVVYLWDRCCNHCIYCPGNITNRKKTIKTGKRYPLKELTIEEAIQDAKAVMSDGHTHICFLTGSWPGYDQYPLKIKPYLEVFDELDLDEIILNIPPQTLEGFKIIRSAVKKTPLQFRVFQETYNRDVYAQIHPAGLKSDYGFRINSQERALMAGFDNVGLGVLFGLNRHPIEEINGLQRHAEMLERRCGKRPARVCLPNANFPEGIGVDVPFVLERGRYGETGELLEPNVYEKFNELVYALARLAMPMISIVSSERDPSGMLKILDAYATNTSLNVHPVVGRNIEFHRGQKTQKNKDEVHFEQAMVFPRDPEATLKDMRMRGYNPILKAQPPHKRWTL